MQLEAFQGLVRNFLASETPEVLCLVGEWGVGKTYAWNKFYEQAKLNGGIALSRYAYVSAFGKNSIEEIKQSIVDNTYFTEQYTREIILSEVQKFSAPRIGGWLFNMFKKLKIKEAVQYAPIAEKYFDSLTRLAFLGIQKQVICIDDIERSGKGIDVIQLLGLISTLKEQKSCKIVLLLNKDAIDPELKARFLSYLEKVVDTQIEFVLAPEEAASLGLNDHTPFRSHVFEDVVKLKIKNIRTIKQIERQAAVLINILGKYDERIVLSALHTLVISIVGKLQPKDAPPLDFLKEYNSIEYLVTSTAKTAQLDENKKIWAEQLQSYRFGHADPLDKLIIEGVDQGIYDLESINVQVQILQKQVEYGDNHKKYEDAWETFHDSFSNNEDHLVSQIESAVRESYASIAPPRFAVTYELLISLGRINEAEALLDFYLQNKHAIPADWDLSGSIFGGEITNARILQAYNLKKNIPRDFDVKSLLLKLANDRSWDPEQIEFLSRVPPSQYVSLFKETRGRELRDVMRGALFFREEIEPPYSTMTQAVYVALRTIASESALNRVRVSRYNVPPAS
jgi:hypothetical protein